MLIKPVTIDIPGNQLYLTLDDGRIVNITGHGDIYVYRPESRGIGSEDYSLKLPTVGYVAEHCNARDDVMSHDRVSIEIQHRH